MYASRSAHAASSTPISSDGRKHPPRCTGTESPMFRFTDLVPITPVPKFAEMDTPEIQKRAKQYGLKKTLGKAKLKTKLNEVYQYTHQVRSPAHTVAVKLPESESYSQDKLSKQHDQDVILLDSSGEGDNLLFTRMEDVDKGDNFVNKLKETPKKSTGEMITNKSKLGHHKCSRPPANSRRGNGGWTLSPSPERLPSFPASVGNVNANQNESFQAMYRDLSYVFDRSFDDITQFSDVNLSGVVAMDAADENLDIHLTTAQTPERTPCKITGTSYDIESRNLNPKAPQSMQGDFCYATAQTPERTPWPCKSTRTYGKESPMSLNLETPQGLQGSKKTIEVISLLDSSGETSTLETEIVQAHINLTSADHDNTETTNLSPKLMLPDCDIVDRNTEMEIEESQINIPSIDHHKNESNDLSPKLMLPNCGFMDRKSMGSFMDKTYESVDMFDALTRKSTSPTGSQKNENPVTQKLENGSSLRTHSPSNATSMKSTCSHCDSFQEKDILHPSHSTSQLDSLLDKTTCTYPDAREKLSPDLPPNCKDVDTPCLEGSPHRGYLQDYLDPDAHGQLSPDLPPSCKALDSPCSEGSPRRRCLQKSLDCLAPVGHPVISLLDESNDDYNIEGKGIEHHVNEDCETTSNMKIVDKDEMEMGFCDQQILSADECSSEEDAGNDREELHRSLFVSFHHDPSSSSSEEEENECKTLMQRLLEKRNEGCKNLDFEHETKKREKQDFVVVDSSKSLHGVNAHLANVRDKRLDDACSLSSSKLSSKNISTSVTNSKTIELPARKQRKVDFFKSSTVTTHGSQENQIPKKTAKSKKPKLSKLELEVEMCKAIRSNKTVYLSVLQYKPVYLSKFKQLMEDCDIRVKASDLLDFLDNKGITFSTADENKNKGPRVRKKRSKK